MLSQDHFIEQLSEVASVRGFLALSCQQFEQQIDTLIKRVFLKSDFAIKSVVDSLFEHQGPLAELPVRLKLLLALGVISADVYADITAFLEMKNGLHDHINRLSFVDPELIKFTYQLKHIDIASANILRKPLPAIEHKDSVQHQMQQHRHERIVRSSLILSISKILDALNIESPL